jgi:hypothetical protein
MGVSLERPGGIAVESIPKAGQDVKGQRSLRTS